MHIEIDLAEIVEVTKRADRLMRRVPFIIQGKLVKQAGLARANHLYQNRTRRLQQSTFAMGPVTYGTDATVSEFGARMPYAGYVEARGFQDIAGHAKAAEADITATLLSEAHGL